MLRPLVSQQVFCGVISNHLMLKEQIMHKKHKLVWTVQDSAFFLERLSDNFCLYFILPNPVDKEQLTDNATILSMMVLMPSAIKSEQMVENRMPGF